MPARTVAAKPTSLWRLFDAGMWLLGTGLTCFAVVVLVIGA